MTNTPAEVSPTIDPVERAVGAEDASKPGAVVGSVRDDRGAVWVIERDVPIPPRILSGPRPGFKRRQWPFAAMRKGDSFFVEATDHSPTQLATNLISAASRYDGQWTTRKERNGVRIWRVS